MRCSRLLVLLLVFGGVPLRAQWSELTVGSEVEQYVRAMQLRGTWAGEASSIRPYDPQVLARWMRDSVAAHPWRSRFTRDTANLLVLRPMVSAGFVGGFPWGFNDGAVWQGKGFTVAASGGIRARWRRVTLRLEPVVFVAQNASFQLLGDTARGANAFVDQQRPSGIDLPQRFGHSSYARFDPGQSELRVDAGPLAVGVSSMPQFWGPGLRHSLLYTGNAAGIPRLFLSSAHAVRTPIGRFSGELTYGKAAPSGYQPATLSANRLVSGIVVVWQPPSGRNFELGAARVYHRLWPSDGLSFNDLAVPFGSWFYDKQSREGGPADNQLASFFFRWRAEERGFEFYGEFGRTDRSVDLRDIELEPEQNAAWLLGFTKLVNVTPGSFWMVRGDIVDGRISSIARLMRAQGTFYEHASVTQGHTMRGQLLGSYLLERTGGLEIAVDRYTSWGRVGGMLTQRAMPEDGTEGVRAIAARSQWALAGSLSRTVSRGEFSLRAGVALDVNRTPGDDATAPFVGASFRLNRLHAGVRP